MRGRFWILLELALVTFGAVCLGWYGGVRVAAAHEQRLLSHELEIARTPVAAAAPLAPESVVARIDIPRLDLSAVAREGVDDRTLDVAVGHVPGTSLPGTAGNSAFAAHRDTFFRPLRNVRSGDIVVLTTPRGRYRYRVTSTRVVKPDDVSVLAPTPGRTLTLVTCYPFYYVGSAPYRFIVRAEMVES